jgi:hypothetical protein
MGGGLPEDQAGVVLRPALVGEVGVEALCALFHLGGELAQPRAVGGGLERLGVAREVGQRLGAVQRIGVGGELARGEQHPRERCECRDLEDGHRRLPTCPTTVGRWRPRVKPGA